MTPTRPGAYTIPSVYVALAIAARRTGRPLAWRWWKR